VRVVGGQKRVRGCWKRTESADDVVWWGRVARREGNWQWLLGVGVARGERRGRGAERGCVDGRENRVEDGGAARGGGVEDRGAAVYGASRDAAKGFSQGGLLSVRVVGGRGRRC